jgi:hypothetical protein
MKRHGNVIKNLAGIWQQQRHVSQTERKTKSKYGKIIYDDKHLLN